MSVIVGQRNAIISAVVIVLLASAILAWAAGVSEAGEVSEPSGERVGSVELIVDSKRYDGKVVEYQGEVVGDVLKRRGGTDHAWINVNDDPYSRQGPGFRLAGYNRGQGILISLEDAKKIKNVGNYGRRGDIVRVIGTFHRSSSAHGGQMMINARRGGRLTVIKAGFSLDNPISNRKILLAVFSVISAALVIAAYRFRTVRRRSS